MKSISEAQDLVLKLIAASGQWNSHKDYMGDKNRVILRAWWD